MLLLFENNRWMEQKDTWTRWQRQLFRFVFVGVGLVLATFPIPRPYLPDLGKLLLPLTTALAKAVAVMVGVQQPYLDEIASDSKLMYVHLVLMLVLAVLGSSIWGWRDRRVVAYPKLQYVLLTGMRYFLAAAMLSYGFAKVFKTQFYLPEPNTLFTPLGEVPRDLLFWSTMGASHSYSVFTGLAEVLVGLLLLFRGSRLVGSLLGIALMVNVVALNLSYDISVKAYSTLLLLLAVLIAAPNLGRLWALICGRAVPASRLWAPTFTLRWQRLAFVASKTFVVCALLFDAVGTNFEQGNFNDDLAPRPAYHGAYQVTEFIANGDTSALDLRFAQRWRRVFVHRQGYLIVQYMDDHMRDYALEIDEQQGRLRLLVDVAQLEWNDLQFRAVGHHLAALSGVVEGDTLSMKLQALDWRALPLLRGEFNWTSDQM